MTKICWRRKGEELYLLLSLILVFSIMAGGCREEASENVVDQEAESA
jgi:hypothetical protein